MSAPDDETAKLLRQQAEDLGNHRITALPLGDRQPGRRGFIQHPNRLFHGAGDARFPLGPRPGGATSGLSPRPARERQVPVEQRWLDIFDDSMVIERKDGLGGGDLHRGGENFRPRRRRSLSDVTQTTRAALVAETKNIALGNSVGPSSFRGRGSALRPGAPGLPGRQRHQNVNFQQRQPPRGAAFQSRPPRSGISGVERAGNWGASGLVHDQGAFFDKMTKNTGLRCPPMVKAQQGASSNANTLAKPMTSVKDLPTGAIEPQIGKQAQPAEKPKDTVEPSKQPLEPPKQPVEQPKPKPSTSGFIPPHLRHTLKRQGPPELKVGEKLVEPKVNQSNQPPAKESAAPISPPDLTPTTLTEQSVATSVGKSPLLAVKEAAQAIPRTATPPVQRITSPKKTPGGQVQLLPTLEEHRGPLASAPKLRGNDSEFDFATPDDLPAGFPTTNAEFATQFWILVAKPLWEQLLEDYDDVQQQIIFLTWYYSERPKEWVHIMKNGPPSRETLLKISEQYMDDDQKAVLAKRRSQEKKFKNTMSPSLESVPRPPSSWWKIDAVDSAAISDWAAKLQQSHRNAMIESLKDRIAEEQDPVQTQILYAKMGILMHDGKKKAVGSKPGAYGQWSASIPNQPTNEPTGLNDEKDDDVSILVLDSGAPKEDNDRDMSKLTKLMRDHGLNPEGNFTTEDDSQLAAEAQTPSEPGWLPPFSPSPQHPPTVLEPATSASTTPLSAPYVSAQSSPRQNRFGGLASIHSGAPSHQGRHRSRHGSTAPKGRVTTSAPAPRDPSDERRQREKEERMREINERFASTKAVKARGVDGHLESIPSLLDFPAHLLNFGPGVALDVAADAFADFEEEPPEIMEDPESNLALEEEDYFTDDDGSSMEYLLGLEETFGIQFDMPEEELRQIRETNRDSFPTLVATRPWTFGLRFMSPVRPGEFFTIELDCTAKMPADFLQELREQVGAEHWRAVYSHPGFRDIIVEATRGFYVKMAKKWGGQFIHGIAD
ncbi:hypothetical protein TWF481_009955 [Arthrobotrys musiformis]|uniref:Uncharacterized protein n=1 Tax=Arthrobotrys musiformis TaxID=47236 RepID=A0AAV9W0F3_9PEZI